MYKKALILGNSYLRTANLWEKLRHDNCFFSVCDNCQTLFQQLWFGLFWTLKSLTFLTTISIILKSSYVIIIYVSIIYLFLLLFFILSYYFSFFYLEMVLKCVALDTDLTRQAEIVTVRTYNELSSTRIHVFYNSFVFQLFLMGLNMMISGIIHFLRYTFFSFVKNIGK